MKQTYFLNEDSERAYSKEYFDKIMISENKTEMEVIEAVVVPEDKEEYIFCTLTDECYEKNVCEDCDEYEFISTTCHRCLHKGNYCDFGNKITLKLNEK